MVPLTSPLREARVSAGLSQAALAAAAGISRQMVGAIEAGHHRPSVDAALALARAVGRQVEALFGTPSEPAQPVLGRPVADGAAVLAARVGGHVVYAPAGAALAYEGWPPANAVLEAGTPRLLAGADLDGFVVVGCDPALGSLAAMLPAGGPRRVVALSGSTDGALAAMGAARAHAAVVHGHPERLPEAPPGALRLHLARWRVGLAGSGRGAPSVAELCASGAPVVQREAGASSQKALVAAALAQGGELAAGPIAAGHLEAARRVAAGALAGVTMEPAALQLGLAFTALEEHVAELWIDERWRAHPAAEAIAAALGSTAFRTRMGLVGGYELADAG